jgi:hypothetical protein
MSDTTTKTRSANEKDDPRSMDEILGPSDREQRGKGKNKAEEKALATSYKRTMKAKIDDVKETVFRAGELFQQVMHDEKLAEEEGHGGNKLVETMVGIVISQLSGGFAKFLTSGIKGLELVIKEALKATAKGAMAKDKPPNESELVTEILKAANLAALGFVEKAKDLVDTMPDDQAAADMRMLTALEGSPAVKEESFEDDAQDGNVARGVENQFLETAGAPLTGPAESEAMAAVMVQTYKAERIWVFDKVGKRNEAVDDALSGGSGKEVEKAEKEVGLDESVKADKNERKRASNLTNPVVPTPEEAKQEDPES